MIAFSAMPEMTLAFPDIKWTTPKILGVTLGILWLLLVATLVIYFVIQSQAANLEEHDL